jgi:hypothetical protein
MQSALLKYVQLLYRQFTHVKCIGLKGRARRPVFEPCSGHVGPVVDKVALGRSPSTSDSPAKHYSGCCTLIIIIIIIIRG